jgi:hypothetical protein
MDEHGNHICPGASRDLILYSSESRKRLPLNKRNEALKSSSSVPAINSCSPAGGSSSLNIIADTSSPAGGSSSLNIIADTSVSNNILENASTDNTEIEDSVSKKTAGKKKPIALRKKPAKNR